MSRRMLKTAVCIMILAPVLLAVVPAEGVLVVDDLSDRHMSNFSKVGSIFPEHLAEDNFCNEELIGNGFHDLEGRGGWVKRWFWRSEEYSDPVTYLCNLGNSGIDFGEVDPAIDHIGRCMGENYNLYPNISRFKTPMDEDILVESFTTGGPNSVHNINTGEDFSSIQAAIDDPDTKDGDTILVDPGVYFENIRVYKSLTIRSTSGNPEDTIIEAADKDSHIFEITADGVEITNFSIRNTGLGAAGVEIISDNCKIYNNIIENVGDGVRLWFSNNSIIEGNIIHHNNFGIYVDTSQDNWIINNVIIDNGDGVAMWRSNSINLTGNQLRHNEYTGILFLWSDNNTIFNNSFVENGDIGLQMFDSDNNTIIHNIIDKNRHYGVSMHRSMSNVFINNILRYNQNGDILLLYYSNRNHLEKNSFYSEEQGMSIEYSSNNCILDNSFMEGMSIEYSSNNCILGNSFTKGGIFFYLSYQNIVKNNTINGKNILYHEGESHINIIEEAGQVILINCSDIRVSNLNSSNTLVGIELLKTNYSKIRFSKITNAYYGIYLYQSSHNIVKNIDCSSNINGVYLYDSDGNFLENIDCSDNVNGIQLSNSNNNFLENINCSDNVNGIQLSYSDDNNILKCILKLNNVGIELIDSAENILRNQSIQNNCVGIECILGTHNIIKDSYIENNYRGIELRESQRNNIHRCIISKNKFCGIYCFHSQHNSIIYNNFINNALHYLGWYGDKNYFYRNYWSGRLFQLPIPYIVSVNWKTNGFLGCTVNIDWFPRVKPYSE